jgi:hypothetical protein
MTMDVPRAADNSRQFPIAANWRRPAARPAPAAAKLLLPVWGYGYVRQFLEWGLPTLLAPGNVPAIAEAMACEFVMLTSAEDEPFIRAHPAFSRLSAVSATEIRLIDHLITGSNHSTTVTLAYTECIRAAGPAALDTCFFFLVSDYIVADGSLRNVLDRVIKGASGVLVGNFQVVQEDAMPWLEEQAAAAGSVLALRPRELIRWGLANLHPTAVANTVNFALSHNSHANRLFWRVDGDTLLGRFYLMHMLCIRPEVTDFIIGSSCDYSFIPELCPSGTVDLIGDSDEYAVIELQSRRHEEAFLRPGPLRPTRLARSLSEWTTARHRQNASQSVIFHAGEVPPKIGAVVAQADAFVADVARAMTKKAATHRGHPYWRGAIAAFKDASGGKLSRDEWRLLLGLPLAPSRLGDFILDRARFLMFGQPPKLRPWHPRWPDYRLVLRRIAPILEDPHRRLLLLSNVPTVFTVALAGTDERIVRARTGVFLDAPPERYETFAERFDLCLLELSEGEMARGDELIDRIAPLMKADGQILIAVHNQRGMIDAAAFAAGIGYHARRLLRPAAIPSGVDFVPASRLRWLTRGLIGRVGRLAYLYPAAGSPVVLAAGIVLVPLSLLANLLAAWRTRATPPRGIASSVMITLHVDAINAKEASKYSAGRGPARRIKPHQRPANLGATAKSITTLPDAGPPIREPQYDRCVDLKSQYGLAPLGLMSNQVWHDDPRQLGFVLARYKFVAKMLNGCRDVGEVGCGDAFGTRIVLQEVERVTVYDFDRVFIEDIRQRHSERWPIESRIHDITLAALPRRHDAIYSLDVIEHIRRQDEDAFLANLLGSLTEDGILILGTPSLESQAHASAPSRAGHVNCKGGAELKVLLERHFARVFLFSMNDEVVHTGFYPMAHYLLAICTGKRTKGPQPITDRGGPSDADRN